MMWIRTLSPSECTEVVAHLEKADGLVPALEGDIELSFSGYQAEAENALTDPVADRSVYRMRHLSDGT